MGESIVYRNYKLTSPIKQQSLTDTVYKPVRLNFLIDVDSVHLLTYL